MGKFRPAVFAACVALACLGSRLATAGESFDKYGGLAAIQGKTAGTFHLERIGSRWWLVTPEGHGIFIRAVSKIDTSDYGGSGGFLGYDGVFLQLAAGRASANLQAAAEDSLTADVVDSPGGATLRAEGDALLLGSSRFRPNFTYFWLDQLGRGGRIEWQYSTVRGWKPINGNGRPHKAEAAGDEGWNLDAGNYTAPDASGFGQSGNPKANKVVWWDMRKGFPDDFAAVALPDDPTPRWYLKAVVRREFAVPPVLNQVYERADLAEGIARKYGPGDGDARWAKAMTERLRLWGFNAAGQYSYRYVVKAGDAAPRLPVEPTWALGGWVTGKDRPYHVKNVYAGAVFPPGSNKLLYQGLQPDVFEPAFERGYLEMVRKESTGGPWNWALIPEEADYLFGIDSLTHDHMAYVVLSQNPYQASSRREGDDIRYDDPRLYAKYALRDFLRDRYRAQGDDGPRFTPESAVPCFAYARDPAGHELAALQNLNAAWGTRYMTWDTSSGDLLKGDHAWGSGTGFMDENGKNILMVDARSVGFDKQFSKPAHPAVRRDLDDFLGVFAARYGCVLAKAFAQVPHPVLLLPIYNGPDSVYAALAPYVDGFWVSVADPQDALRIYNAAHKPLLVADYLAADPDSPLYFNVPIQSVRYDKAKGSTFLRAPGLRYRFRMAQFVTIPDCPALVESYRRIGRPYPSPRVKSVAWDTVEIPGDYSGLVKPGMHLELWKYGKYPYEYPTQEKRAEALVGRYKSLVDLRGDDGLYFVIGIEHWCLYDPALSNWGDNQNFGLATLQDNAYDGVEARRAVGRDARGYSIGGEDADYGNLLGKLGGFLQTIDHQLPGTEP